MQKKGGAGSKTSHAEDFSGPGIVFNPRFTVREAVCEPMRIRGGFDKNEVEQKSAGNDYGGRTDRERFRPLYFAVFGRTAAAYCDCESACQRAENSDVR